MLNRTKPAVYNNSEKKEKLWIQGYVLFASLKNYTAVFTKARKEKMDMRNSVKLVDWLRVVNIIKNVLKSLLLKAQDGLKEILKKLPKIVGLITKEIRKRFWIRLEQKENLQDIRPLKLTEAETEKRLNAIIMSGLLSNSVNFSNLLVVTNVKMNVSHKAIIMITQSHWKWFGFVRSVMAKNTEHVYQRERLNLWTPKGDAIVQATEETCRGESEAVLPPRNWSVSKLLLKVIEWLRHTAGCSFYQGKPLKLALNKSSLIDLEAYDYAEAA